MSFSISSHPDSFKMPPGRKYSSHRADLDAAKQFNFAISWFVSWSDLQKSDFVPVLGRLAGKSSSPDDSFADDSSSIASSITSCSTDVGHSLSRRPKPKSIYQCQVDLIKTWLPLWSDDMRADWISRLAQEDAEFEAKYSTHIADNTCSLQTASLADMVDNRISQVKAGPDPFYNLEQCEINTTHVPLAYLETSISNLSVNNESVAD